LVLALLESAGANMIAGTLSAVPTNHKVTGSFTIWAGTPYARVPVMGTP